MPKSFTQKAFSQTLLKATRLTGKGQLMDATRMIQRALASLNPLPANQPVVQPVASPVAPMSRKAVNDASIIDVEARDISPQPAAAPGVHEVFREAKDALREAFFPAQADKADKTEKTATPVEPVSAPSTEPPLAKTAGPEALVPQPAAEVPASYLRRPAAFTQGTTQFKGDQYPYRLYLPAGPKTAAAAVSAAPTRLPLVVMLHGCKQDSLDFATGTQMNALADQQQFAVLYPEQISRANAGSCWNWFETEHQSRSGEPGMIAALVKKTLAASHHDLQIDPDRVYIAGLSAGGAMATITAGLYPELFAAVGVHSGLPAGSANSMIGAFSAMRRGSSAGQPVAHAVPTIVFHGTQDQTVHPDNGDHISASARGAFEKAGLQLEKTEARISGKGDKPAGRVVYQDASGKPLVEHWLVSDGGHAWFGGAAAGSYTDPQAPSASKAMLAFFMQHRQTGKSA